MPRTLRHCPADLVYHLLNRASGRLPLFETDGDYRVFEQALEQAVARTGIRLLAYGVMPNHWHLVVQPRTDHDVSAFMTWLTMTHTRRWHVMHDSVGTGHLYQGRFRSFPAQSDEHVLTVCRYVERNALRANLVARAEDWPWSSLWRRQFGGAEASDLLSDWPVPRPDDWLEWVNAPQSDDELAALRVCAQRGQPFGDGVWTAATADRLGLGSTFRQPGRPRQAS